MRTSTSRLCFILTVVMTCLTLYNPAFAYPLDGEEESGIRRLQGYRLLQENKTGAKLNTGQLWNSEQIVLHLLDYKGPEFDTLEQDPQLAIALNDLLKKRDPSYSMVLLDFSNSENIRWAGLRPDLKQNPGSVGKLLCMTALFHALAEAFPDTEERALILKTAVSKAGDWVNDEVHAVPKWDDTLQRNRFSVINANDSFRLGEWIDHAISVSANGAGTVIWREAMLIQHFGKAYPVSDETRQTFFAQTSKAELSALAKSVITEPLVAAGIDVNNLQQGSFFTGNAKRKVPGGMSFATTRELARFMFRMEQGRLVDEWSSLQMKKFMYLTKRRYRYAYAPELANDAVFFKSGSLYSCRAEPDFRCGKYMGNVRNMLNSVATIEGHAASDPHYSVALMSNVLKVNSAWDHSRIAAAVHAIVYTRKSQVLKETASDEDISNAGKSD